MLIENRQKLLRFGLPSAFFIFISWIIYLADNSNHNFAFSLVGHIPYGDKIAHALLYGLMALFLNFGLNFKTKNILGYSMQMGSMIVLLFAGIEELSQYYFPSRTLDIYDFIADFIGVVLASFIRKKALYFISCN